MNLPPKVSTAIHNVRGRARRIRVVRRSMLCRLLNNRESVVVGNTIFVRAPLLTQRVLRKGITKIEAQNEIVNRLLTLIGF